MITPMTIPHWNKTIPNHLKKRPEGKEGGRQNAEIVYLCFLKYTKPKDVFFHPKRFLELTLTISLTNLIDNSPDYLPYNSYDASSLYATWTLE